MTIFWIRIEATQNLKLHNIDFYVLIFNSLEENKKGTCYCLMLIGFFTLGEVRII